MKMIERLSRRGIGISAAVVLGLGAVSCSSESESDTSIAHCTIAPENFLNTTLLGIMNTPANITRTRQFFANEGLQLNSIKNIIAECDTEIQKSEVTYGKTVVTLTGLEGPCYVFQPAISTYDVASTAGPAATNLIVATCAQQPK